MKWYFTFNESATDWYDEMIRVAVVSAAERTSLEAHCLYDGQPTSLTMWLERQGVRIHPTRVRFADAMRQPSVLAANAATHFNPSLANGFFLLLEVPNVEQEDEFVLFTDVDVYFNREIDLSRVRPRYLAAVPEVMNLSAATPPSLYQRASLSFMRFTRGLTGAAPTTWAEGFNSGVVLMNTAALRAEYDKTVAVLAEHNFFDFPTTGAIYDQGLLNLVYRNRWEPLSPYFNWRAFWGSHDKARIVHFHGAKPRQVAMVLQDKATFFHDGPARRVDVDDVCVALIMEHSSRYCGPMNDFVGCLARAAARP